MDGVSLATLRAPSPALLVTVLRSMGFHVWYDDVLVIEARPDGAPAIVWHGKTRTCSDEGCRVESSVSLSDEDRDGDLDLVVVAEDEGAEGTTIRSVFARGPDGSFPPSDMVGAPLRP